MSSPRIYAAVLTPLKDDLAPDIPAWLDHCRWLLAEGLTGLAILGTTSEANSFSVDERLAMLDAIGMSDIDARVVIPGTGCCAIPDTVKLSKKAVSIGCSGVLALPPFYYKPVSDDGLFAAYSEVIQRVGDQRLKLYLYHIPQNTGVPITLKLIEKLLGAYPDTVVGIKDSSGDFTNMAAMVKNFPGFRVLSGSDQFLLDLLRAGGAGSITACNNIAARLSARVIAHWRDQKGEAAQAELSAVRKTVQQYPLVEALKEIMASFTGRAAWRTLRPPLRPLARDEATALIDALDKLGFAMPKAA